MAYNIDSSKMILNKGPLCGPALTLVNITDDSTPAGREEIYERYIHQRLQSRAQRCKRDIEELHLLDEDPIPSPHREDIELCIREIQERLTIRFPNPILTYTRVQQKWQPGYLTLLACAYEIAKRRLGAWIASYEGHLIMYELEHEEFKGPFYGDWQAILWTVLRESEIQEKKWLEWERAHEGQWTWADEGPLDNYNFPRWEEHAAEDPEDSESADGMSTEKLTSAARGLAIADTEPPEKNASITFAEQGNFLEVGTFDRNRKAASLNVSTSSRLSSSTARTLSTDYTSDYGDDADAGLSEGGEKP